MPYEDVGPKAAFSIACMEAAKNEHLHVFGTRACREVTTEEHRHRGQQQGGDVDEVEEKRSEEKKRRSSASCIDAEVTRSSHDYNR